MTLTQRTAFSAGRGSKTATTYLLDVPDLLAVVQVWDSYSRTLAPRSGLWYPALQRDGAPWM